MDEATFTKTNLGVANMLANQWCKFQIFVMTGVGFTVVCVRSIFPTNSCVTRLNSKIRLPAPNFSKELKLVPVDSVGCVDDF